MESESIKNILILGGGFAGLQAAKVLANTEHKVTVIDRCNHHLFQPLLYQVATAALSPADISMPIRSIVRNVPNVEVIMAEIQSIDVENKKVLLDRNEVLSYDYLVVATGARHSYFNHPEWEEMAPGLKTLEDATEIRRRILSAFEEAERSTRDSVRKEQLTFVIVGGGPTGIELAGATAELAKVSLAKDFRHINPRFSNIVLVEAGERLLPEFHRSLSKKAVRSLEKLGVQVLTGRRVTEISPDGVTINGEFLPAKVVIWAAGVSPSTLNRYLGAPLDRLGRVSVEPDLSIQGHPDVFAVGDLAAMPWTKNRFVPGMAPGAIQSGRHAAKNILRRIAGEETTPFRYFHKGSTATIGRARAVVELGKVKFSGFPAWIAWLLVHIFYLIGFRNRVLVMFQWAWSYFTFQKGTRLITVGRRSKSYPADLGDNKSTNP